ncbi:TetR/AcrR family transcriptional regulator [Lentzea sp. NPDC058436]|uniref:TetR/AcrR family transcriptional regulator n=1 Tax=Lentzea sp. NPDC058436 TaxID=3346499 RepID=UPI00364BD325
MSSRSVAWTTPHSPEEASGEGLRERKKRLMRQQLSDTATEMFVERGFEAVRVSEIAAACGVSEKTVFNYFPSKEALVLDRWEATTASLRQSLRDHDVPPVEAVRRVLDTELDDLLSWVTAQPDPESACDRMWRFIELTNAAPSLRAHQRDSLDAAVSVVAEILAERAGLAHDAPEPHIAAIALIGLWDVQARALRRHLADARDVGSTREEVADEVRRAAHLVESGLATLGPRR